MKNGVVMFTTTGVRYDPPACGLTVGGRWAIEGSTAAGKNQVAAVLSAYATGKPMQVFGANVCSAWLDTETVEYIVAQ